MGHGLMAVCHEFALELQRQCHWVLSNFQKLDQVEVFAWLQILGLNEGAYSCMSPPMAVYPPL
jgi:hypothetical protein